MALFDDDILDVESESHDVLQQQENLLYKDWLKYIKTIPKIYEKDRWNQIQLHNFENDIDDVDTLSFRFVSYDMSPNTILCPLEFILDSPRYINFLCLDAAHDVNKGNAAEGIEIIWYTFREYENGTIVKERTLTKGDIETLSILKYPENSTLPVSSIIVRALFDDIDTYCLFVKVIHENFPNADIYIHYDSRVCINNVPLDITSVFYQYDLTSLNTDNNIEIVYQSFPVNGAEIKYQFKK